ncbi:hypothetical protein niasHT_019845 [Heterodera trifolii]|uniref:Uncharacterized protein n=1 Tax=Heterodera trifolii TaxID=157864 RepID=A0ABD2KUU2_9BILA
MRYNLLLLLILLSFLLPQIISLQFNWWHHHPKSRHKAINATIHKCCPTHAGTTTPLYCCADELFDNGPEFPQEMCKDNEGVEMTTILKTISCAQTEFHRQIGGVHSPTDICRNFCCDFLMNVEGSTKETACSRTCAKASFAIGTSIKKQLRELRRMGCAAAKTQFAALEDCLKGPAQYFNDISQRSSSRSANDDDDDDEQDVEMAKMRALNEVCRQRAEEEQNS